ncbi:MAG: iron-sulfur cluster repair protein YtfE [Candidatus Poribacteria bacterium]|nr:MAG: iron-sulfur cluster repair protein YtfE [Candidatus Poribacteria bacterium]
MSAHQEELERLLQTPVGQIAAERPAAVVVFREAGINFWTEGRRTLEAACAAQRLDPGKVVAQLERRERQTPSENPQYQRKPPAHLSDAELIRQIESGHHSFARIVLRRLEALAERLARRGLVAAEFPAEVELLSCRIEEHLVREETLLFPRILAGAPSLVTRRLCRELREEHHFLYAALEDLRRELAPQVSQDPNGTLFLHCLDEFLEDATVHFHLESNLLFARVERSTRASGTGF